MDHLVVRADPALPLVCAPSRLKTQGGARACAQDASPGALLPRDRTCVVDVDAGVHRRPLALTQSPLDVVRMLTGREDLMARDDAVLRREDCLDVHGRHRRQPRREHRHRRGCRLWIADNAWIPGHQVDRDPRVDERSKSESLPLMSTSVFGWWASPDDAGSGFSSGSGSLVLGLRLRLGLGLLVGLRVGFGLGLCGLRLGLVVRRRERRRGTQGRAAAEQLLVRGFRLGVPPRASLRARPRSPRASGSGSGSPGEPVRLLGRRGLDHVRCGDVEERGAGAQVDRGLGRLGCSLVLTRPRARARHPRARRPRSPAPGRPSLQVPVLPRPGCRRASHPSRGRQRACSRPSASPRRVPRRPVPRRPALRQRAPPPSAPP